MKICAISPFVSASKEEILEFLNGCNNDLVVLPGNYKNHPSYKDVVKVLNPGISAFVETGDGKGDSIPWLVSVTRQIMMPRQIFGTSDPTAGDMDDLQKKWKKRTHTICDRSVSFAICGEINAFNVDTSIKKNRYLPYDVLVNPAHTVMGRWNYLKPKLENLSENTAVVHVANNDRNHHKLTTDVRIYVNGDLMQGYYSGNIGWSECEI
ncbi:hypothetical protein QUF75_05680 [Desulfococcaceae bacterium HSG7]|nr:hypothetical protein [Desulfococcaceae bacterium HSG7]